jgi:peptidoglycan/LPS O-acetylase OafA/YrhL
VLQDAAVSLLYLADYGIAFFDSPGTLLHMWSLSVEEHFYLLWPPVLMLLVRGSRPGQVWRPVALLYLLSWAWRLMWVAQGQQFYEIFFRFDTRASGLLAGSLLAALLHERPALMDWLQERLPHAMWLPLAVPLLMELGWDNQGAMVWGITVVELATMVLLLAMHQRSGLVFEMLRAPALVRLGTLSYGIYLWHYPVVRYLRAELPWPLVVPLALAISAALAALSFHTVERWGLALRDRRPRAGTGSGRRKPNVRTGRPGTLADAMR